MISRKPHPSILIDRYYRGAVVACEGKIYWLAETSIRILEEIFQQHPLPRDSHTRDRIRQLEKLGLLVAYPPEGNR